MPYVGKKPKARTGTRTGTGTGTSGRQRQRRRPDPDPPNSDHYQDQDPDHNLAGRFQSDSTPPGRLRRYARPDNPLHQWNSRSKDTPEGRLSDVNSSDWTVPEGSEVHLRTDDGQLRCETADADGGGGSYDQPNQSRYRSDDFHVKATNSHDHKEQMRISITPEMLSTIDSILISKKLPFGGSRQQFASVALYELIQVCTRLEPMPDSHVAVLESMNELHKNYQVVVGYDTTIRRLCRTVHDLVEARLKNQARVMLHDLIRTIQRIKSRELREKHLKRVRAEFGKLIGESKPVSGRPVRTNKKR